MSLELFETIEQGTPEWFAVRAGIPTASRFSDVLAEGKGISRAKYLRQLAGERVSGKPMVTFKSPYMDRGHALEDEVRRSYTLLSGNVARRVGFAKNHGAGCSPDSLVDDTGGVEFKTAEPHVLIEIIEKMKKNPAYFPPEHVAQVQGNLWVLGREWWDLVLYSDGMPNIIVRRAQRDVAKIAELAREIASFNRDLDALVETVRAFS